MTVDSRLNIFGALFLLLIDTMVMWQSSKLLSDFLIGNTSERQSKDITKSQSLLKQFTKSYIYPHLKYSQDKKDFKKYYFLYIVEIVTILPQYSLIGAQFIYNTLWMFCLMWGLGIIKVAFFVIFNSPSWPGPMGAPSKYAYKPGNRRKQ